MRAFSAPKLRQLLVAPSGAIALGGEATEREPADLSTLSSAAGAIEEPFVVVLDAGGSLSRVARAADRILLNAAFSARGNLLVLARPRGPEGDGETRIAEYGPE